jgi:hypothetical protein
VASPISVACPKCEAEPNDRCRTPFGIQTEPHTARRRAAAGIVPPLDVDCPLCRQKAGDSCRNDRRGKVRPHARRVQAAKEAESGRKTDG